MSSSKGERFTDDELQAATPWTVLQNFSEAVAVEEPIPTLTVEQVETMQKQAYDEAFEQGRREGFEQGRQQGFEQGRQDGYQAGLQRGYQENLDLIKQQVADWQRLLSALSQPLHDLDAQVEDELVKLAIAIAQQLVRREIKHDPGQIVAVVREAVKVLPLSSQHITVNLHPEDAELVRSALALDDTTGDWKIHENPVVTQGGCIVETDVSFVDATVESRLAAVIATVLGGERQQDANR